jgi:O-antigen ligase
MTVFEPLLPRLILRGLEQLIWLAFLVLITWLAFCTQPYRSTQWMLISTFAYTLASLYVMSLLVGVRCGLKSLESAKWLIIILVSSSVWLCLQWLAPLENTFITRVFGENLSPEWFQPSFRLSVVPELTKWMFLSSIFELVLFLMALSLIDTRLRLKQLLGLLLLVGLVHCAIAVAAKFGDFYLVDVKQLDGHYEAARGFFINRNHLAAFGSLTLIGAMAFQLHILIRNKSKQLSSFWLAQIRGFGPIFLFSIGMGLSAIILSQSRAGFLSILVGFIITGLVQGNSRQNLKWIGRIWVPASITLILIFYFLGQDLMQRFSSDILSLGERPAQWAITWQAIKQQIITGYGAGSYSVVFQVWREFTELRYVVFDQSHSLYFHLWLEQGLIGLGLWLAFVGLFLRSNIRAGVKNKSALVRATVISASIVVIAALTQALVDFNLQIMNIRSYFFVIIALAVAAPKIKHIKQKSHKSRPGRDYSQHSFSVADSA